MSQNILGAFHAWFGERISMLERASKYIEYSNMLENEENINNFLNVFAANSPEFDLIQLQSENEDIWAGGHKIPRGNSTTIREGLLWYAETKMLKKPTVNFMPKHYVLGQETLNFCVPNFYNGEFKAVLCGIVKINAIFEKMKNFKIPSNSYIFIAKNDGKILTPFSNEKLKTRIQTKLNDMFLKDSVKNELNIGSNFIAISEIEYLSWFIGAGTDNKQEANALLGDMAKSAFSLLGGFLLLTLFINLLHNIAYKKINKRKEEYELILAHKARMSEIGELISGINHQFIQPVNSLRLINSTLISLKNDNKLSYEKLQAMLENQNRSISLLSDTIEIFRNFYKTSENIEKFSIKQCIKNLLALMHTELSAASIRVNLKDFDDKEIMQIQNIIQQILLILLHNAKDALLEKFKDDKKLRIIDIDVKFKENKCQIYVIDNGNGLSKHVLDKIFDTPKTTKKLGNGIGLYFGKKLARQKINGDIFLKNDKNPTCFCLEFDSNLGAKDDKCELKATL